MNSRGSRSVEGALPPWLWFWLGATLILAFREGPISLLGEGIYLFTGYPALGTHVSSFRMVGLAFVLPLGVLLAGAATVLLPWVRAAFLERHYALSEPSPGLFAEKPTLKKICDFVHAHDPGIRIRVNKTHTGGDAFVYPLGHRKAAIAIFSLPMIVLWQKHRSQAEAVLLHEIGHRRHGDVLIIGAGSLFTTFVRYGLIVGTAGLTVGFTAFELRFIGGVPDTSTELLTMGLVTLSSPIVALVVSTPLLIMPVAGIWSAEFSADRYAIEAQGSSDALLQFVSMPRFRQPKQRWFRWLVWWMSHPPHRLRSWAVRRYSRPTTSMVLLCLFPAASLIGALCQVVWDTKLFQDRQAFLAALQANLDQTAPYWVAMVAFIALWPCIAGLWERLFGAEPPTGRKFG